jgi:hypothetical protein
MRKKITFLQRGRIANRPHLSQQGVWIRDHAKDSELTAESRELIETWRCIYEPSHATPRQDMRATLEALARIGDDEARAAVGAIDLWTEASLATAALKMLKIYQQTHSQTASLPDGFFEIKAWSPAQIRAIAAFAIKDLRGSRGGRPTTRRRDIAFARVLIGYWQRAGGEQSKLLKFAKSMFSRVGRDLKSSQLRALFLAARSMG